MKLETLSPARTRAALEAGARLVDIRGVDEFARERIPGAINLPIERIDDLPRDGQPVVFHCKSGMRTEQNAARLLAAVGDARAYVLSGGINGWRAAGEVTILEAKQPIELMRQVQICAGALVLTGVLLGLFVEPGFFGLSAFVGAGLMVAGATGWCGMAKLLRLMPWNRRAAA